MNTGNNRARRIACVVLAGSALILFYLPSSGYGFLPKNPRDSRTVRYTTHAGITRVALDLAFANGALSEVRGKSWEKVIVRGVVWEDEQNLLKPPFYRVTLRGGEVREHMDWKGQVLDVTTPSRVFEHASQFHEGPHKIQWNIFSYSWHFHHKYAGDPHVRLSTVSKSELRDLANARLLPWIWDPVTMKRDPVKRKLFVELFLALSESHIKSVTGKEYASQLFNEAVATYIAGDKLTAYHMLGRVAHILEDQATLLHAALITHIGNELTVAGGLGDIESYWSSLLFDENAANYGSHFPTTIVEITDIETALDDLNDRMLSIAARYPRVFGTEDELKSRNPPRKVLPKGYATVSEEQAKSMVHEAVPIATSYVAGLFRLFEKKVQENAARHGVSLCVVLDRSGSMKQAGKIATAKRAATSLLSYLGIDDSVSIISFSDAATTHVGPTRMGHDNARRKVGASISGISASGGTDYNAGLTAAYDIVRQVNASQQRAVLFLSDGLPGEQDYSAVVDLLRQASIPVFTIAFGTDANESILNQIAKATGGQHFSGSLINLQQVFSQIGGRSKGLTEYIVRRGVIRQFKRNVETLLLLRTNLFGPNSQSGVLRQAKFVLNWGGSNLGLSLVTPGGQIITEASAASTPGVSFAVDATNNFKVFTISDPSPGKWTAEVEGLDVPDTGEMYSLTASIGTPWVTNPTPFRAAYLSNQNVSLGISIGALDDLRVRNVTARVTEPRGRNTRLALNDAGRDGDAQAGDNLYSLSFASTRDVGLYQVDYEIEATIRGSEVHRTVETTFQIGSNREVLEVENRDVILLIGGVPAEMIIRTGTIHEPIHKIIDLGKDIDFAQIKNVRLRAARSSHPDLNGKIYNYRFKTYHIAGSNYTRLLVTVFPELLPESGKFEVSLRLTATDAADRQESAILNLLIQR